jgi:hypothetical protein
MTAPGRAPVVVPRQYQALAAISYGATERSQLRSLSEELAAVSGNELLAQQPVTTWAAALAAVAQFASEGKRTLVVIDEFQYLAAQQGELETLLNRWWRTTGRTLPLVLIIAGSEISFFRERVLAGQMYGRRDGQWQVLPFDISSAHPRWLPELLLPVRRALQAAKRTEDREVDAVALDGDGKVLATGSCKWTSARMDFGEEMLLSQVEPYIPGAEKVERHYFFSRSGFTDQLHKLAEADPARYRLVMPEDIYA